MDELTIEKIEVARGAVMKLAVGLFIGATLMGVILAANETFALPSEMEA